VAVASVHQGLERTEAPTASEPRRSWILAVAGVCLVAMALVVGVLVGRESPRFPGDRSAEAGFVRDMSAHHEQAVEMAELIRDRTDDPEVRTLAMDIALTQQGQIGQMMGWLDVWDLLPTGEEPPMAWMGHPAGERMPGMATRQELAHLAELSGEEADREFLRLMIRHHQGGVPMAEAILERTDRDEVRRLARSIIESQTAEVETMTGMLERKGGEPVAGDDGEGEHGRSGG
jgi:uncharacterized protein (DUF305 family)